MKKLVRALPALGVLALATDATAQVLYEPFNYTAGSTLTTSSTAPGLYNVGQGTAWNRTGSNANDIAVASTPLFSNYPGLPPVQGNGVKYVNSNNSDSDRLGLGMIGQSGDLYYSYLLQLYAIPGSTGGLAVSGLNNYVYGQPGTAGLFQPRIDVKKVDATHWTAGLADSAAVYYDSNPNHVFTLSNQILVVAKVTIDPTSLTGDKMSLWINPDPSTFGSATPPTPDLTENVTAQITDATSTTPPLPQYASILLRGSITAAAEVAELRVDSKWAGVTPAGNLQYTYNGAGNGNWSDTNGWNNSTGSTGATPNTLGAVANFGSAITGATTVNVDSPQTVDTININNANSVTITGAALTISSNASMGQIITSSNQTVGAPLVLASDLGFKPASGTTLTLASNISGAGFTLHKYAGGTVKLASNVQIAGSPNLNVHVGTVDLGGTSQTIGAITLGVGSDNTATTSGGNDFAEGFITNGNLNISGTSTLYSGTISAGLSGTGSIEKWASLPVTFSGQNTYSGTTKILWGTLVAATMNTLSPNSAITVGTVLDMTGQSQKVGSLSGTGAVRIGGATLDVGNDNGSSTFSGNIANASGVLVKSGTGNFTINGALSTYDGGTIIKNGSITVAADGSLGNLAGPVTLNGGALNISTGFTSVRSYVVASGNGAINVAASQTLAATTTGITGTGTLTKSGDGELDAVNIRGPGLNLTAGKVAIPVGGGTAGTSVLSSVAVSNGTFDVGDHSMIVNYSGASPASQIRTLLQSGYNGGAWNGNGISSAGAAADTNFRTALGYAEASQLGIADGGSFAGQSVPGQAVLVKYTYYGDNDLDGKVTLNDFSIFVDGFNGLGSGWVYGDYDYSGAVNLTDFQMFVDSYKNQGAALSDLRSAILSDSDLSSAQRNAMLNVVPEPGSLSLLAIGAGAMGLRRRRKV